MGSCKETDYVLLQRDERRGVIMMDGTIKRDIVNYRRQKAHDLMHDVDILIENELWNSTVNRMYYACFHIISALLIMHEIEAKTHMGVRQAFWTSFCEVGHIRTGMWANLFKDI